MHVTNLVVEVDGELEEGELRRNLYKVVDFEEEVLIEENTPILKTKQKHAKLMHNTTFNICVQCGQSFSHIEALRKHICAAHLPSKLKHTCTSCNLSFINSKHWKIHTCNRSFVCTSCNLKFLNSTKLNKHVCKAKETPLTFSCNQCDQVFTQEVHLKRHTLIHSGMKPFCCDKCGKSFGTAATWSAHKRTHNKFLCTKCRSSFDSSNELEEHAMNHIVCCVICKKQVSRLGFMKRHMKTHQ